MDPSTAEELATEVHSLRARLLEAEETLRAIREGEVDALLVSERQGEKVYTLKSADRSYRLMIERMRQGAVSLTADGQLLFCNNGFAQLLKLPPGEVDGDLARFVAPEFQPLLAALLHQGWIGGSSQGEVVLLASDGGRIPVYLAFTALTLEEGLFTLLLVVTDLTEQKQIEELRLLNRAKDEFLATLSHELRTPLAPVMAVISRLEGDARLPSDVHAALAMVHRNVELEARLIDDLLDLTRIARGKLELARRVTDLRPVLAQVIETCCSQVVSGGRVRIVQELAAPDHRVWADPSRLSQVFWNLLNNAVKFTPEGGTIRIRSWSETRPGAPEERELVLEVSDTGIGIRQEVLAQIFSAFDQGDRGTARRFGGLGLGLTISRAIVERHGGTLTAASGGAGQGATFTIRMPQTGEPVDPGLPLPEETGASELPLHILLVEDHADTAEAMAALLSALGHRVTVAGTIAAALAAAREAGGIDLVVSDLGLPDGNGHDLMRELAGRHGLRGIALSGYGMEEDIRRSHEAGFARHLTKPVDAESFKAAIRQVAALPALSIGS
jgi:signal transduction histidine kinase/ActR/RegA family two-component response regulator